MLNAKTVKKGMAVRVQGRDGIVDTFMTFCVSGVLSSVCVRWLKADGSVGKRFNWIDPKDVDVAPSYVLPRTKDQIHAS